MTKYQIYYLLGLYFYINIFMLLKLIKLNISIKSKIIAVFILFIFPFGGYFFISKKYNDADSVDSSGKIGMIITAIIFYGFIFLLLG